MAAGLPLYAQGPALLSAVASDPDNGGDDTFSNSDQITLTFDQATNQPIVNSTAAIDALFIFSQSLGTAYAGSWTSATTLVITVSDITGNGGPATGATTVTVISPSALRDAADINDATAGVYLLAGNWGTGAFAPFRGGLGMGAGDEVLVLSTCASFIGGSGDGHAGLFYDNPLACDSVIFWGGIADGAATNIATSANCGPFLGGLSDGFAKNGLNIECQMYTGGLADGVAYDVSPITCTMYTGGLADGFSNGLSPLVCTMYMGGNNDGYTNAQTTPLACTMFYGGLADGAATDSSWTVSDTLYWRGKNTNWHDPFNWTGCIVPTCQWNVVILPTANDPVIYNAAAVCRTIVIRTGAALQINSTYNLDVCGDMINYGGFGPQANSTVTLIGTIDQAIEPAWYGSTAFNGLKVNKPAGVVNVNETIEVEGMLTLQKGIVVTAGTKEVVVMNRASAAVVQHSALSYIQGRLRRLLNPTGSYDFPVGTAIKGYQLANINFTAATSIDNLLARFTEYAALPTFTQATTECGLTTGYDGDVLDNGKWVIDADPPAMAATGTYTATLHNAAYSNPGLVHTVIKQPTGASNAWALDGTCAGQSATAVSRSGMVGFSEFATGKSGDAPLPIEQLAFSLTPADRFLMLNWSYPVSQQLGRFVLERSTNGTGFQQLRTVSQLSEQATGTYAEYSYPDFSVVPNQRYYYRVKLENLDGSHSYSEVLEGMLFAEQNAVKVYPNPTAGLVNLVFDLPVAEPVTVVIYNQLGQPVMETNTVPDGGTHLVLDLAPLPAAAYRMKATLPDGSLLHQIIIKGD